MGYSVSPSPKIFAKIRIMRFCLYLCNVNGQHILFYDGRCGFCNFWVQFILERDAERRFRFASLQSDFGQAFLRDRGLPQSSFGTLYLWMPQQYYLTKSQAVFKIASLLGGFYRLIGSLRLLPAWLTDLVYDKVAERREKIAAPTCMLPGKEQHRFLSTEEEYRAF